MDKFEDWVQSRVGNGPLLPVQGLSVNVVNTAGTPAALFADDGTTLLQPLRTDSNGYYGFRAADGKYTAIISGPNFVTTKRQVILEDPEEAPYATLAQLAAPAGSTLVNHNGTSLKNVLDDLIAGGGGSGAPVDQGNPGASATLDIYGAWADGSIAPVSDLGEDAGAAMIGTASGETLQEKLDALTASAGGDASKQSVSEKDAVNGYPGLSGFNIRLKNSNGTISSELASAAVTPRTWTLPNKDGTVAMLSDASGMLVFLGSLAVGSPIANIDFLNAFTSAYDSYVIELVNINPVTASNTLTLRFAYAGAVDSTGTYAAITGHGNTASSGQIGISLNSGTGVTGDLNGSLHIMNANGTTGLKTVSMQGTFNSAGQIYVASGVGCQSKSAVASGFRLSFNSGNVNSGTVRVYGIKNS